MEINSSNGINVYTNAHNAAPPIDNTQLRQENIEASRTDIDTEDAAAQAFKVSITQEAQDRMAAESSQETEQTAPLPPIQPEDTSNEPAGPAQDTSPIVNIVA